MDARSILPLLLLLLSTLRGVSAPTPLPYDPSTTTIQILTIIEALVGAGDFGSWANLLFGMDPTILPTSITLFVPGNAAFSHLNLRSDIDPSIIQYHVVPRRLSFSDLILSHAGDRIPTLLRNKTILVTSNAASNFTLNDVHVMVPDLYTNEAIAVHGIADVLNYTVYGSVAAPEPDSLDDPEGNSAAQAPDVEGETMTPPDREDEKSRSGAPYLSTKFPTILSVIFAGVLALRVNLIYSLRGN